MVKYKGIVITDAGLELLSKAYECETKIMFTAVKTGNGIYDGTENLSGATALKSEKQSFGLSGISRTGAQVKVRSVLSNEGLTIGYNITEVGLFAKDSDTGSEFLYAIIVAETGLEDYLPPFEETPTSITLEMYIAIAEEQSKVMFAAEVVAGTYVSVEDFQDHVSDEMHLTAAERTSWNAKADEEDLQTHVANKSNPHGVTKSQVGLGNVPNVATNDQTPTYTEASANVALTSGEKLSVAFGKIAKAIKSLIAHIADTTSHVTSTEKNTWNGKANASHSHSKSEITDFPTTMAPSSHKHTKSEITDFPSSMPASDVSAWAKTSSKPAYTASEVGLGNVPNVSTNDQTPTFTQASSRANIASGEKLSALFGKIMKWFADLKTVAFSGSYSDLSNKPTIPVAVAVKGDAESTYRTGNINLTPANIGAAASSHTHSASDIITGVLPIANGGTGAATAAAALSGLGAASIETGTFTLTHESSGCTFSGLKYAKIGKLVVLYGYAEPVQSITCNAGSVFMGLPFSITSALNFGILSISNSTMPKPIESTNTNINIANATSFVLDSTVDFVVGDKPLCIFGLYVCY